MSRRIAIVEDESSLQELIQINLESEGYQVKVYSKGDEAINDLDKDEGERVESGASSVRSAALICVYPSLPPYFPQPTMFHFNFSTSERAGRRTERAAKHYNNTICII